VFLIAPLMAMGIWERAKVGASTPVLTPDAAVDAFLSGHAVVPGSRKHRMKRQTRASGRAEADRRRSV
jgi:hypothetical protein